MDPQNGQESDQRPNPYPDVAEMSLGDHLEELRKRIMIAGLGLLPLFAGALLVGKWVLGILIVPAQEALRDRGLPAVLQVTGPLEMFGSYVRVAIIVTALCGSPWILWQVWKFVRPGLYHNERRFLNILAPLSAVMTITAGAFLYYLMLPVVLIFFIGFSQSVGLGNAVQTAPAPQEIVFPAFPLLEADPSEPDLGTAWINTQRMEIRFAIDGDTVRAVPLTSGTGVAQHFRVSEYVKMVFSLAMALAVAFQLPVVVLLLGWVDLVTPEFLAKYRRYALMICAVLSALLTPADPVSMIIMLIPLYGLYELGGLLLRWMPATPKAKTETDEGGQP